MDGAKFRRQVPIGPYFADLCCIASRLIVEVDGSQHTEQERYDAARTVYLRARGYRVLRFANIEVLKNLEGVVESIQEELRKSG